MAKIISVICILFLSVGCDNNIIGNDINDFLFTPLELHMESGQDSNGYWSVEYKGYNYTHVNYTTEPDTYVSWSSPDSFYVSHSEFSNIVFATCIICCSTNSGDDGRSKQMIYINENSVGDTLTIKGCVTDNCEILKFIVY